MTTTPTGELPPTSPAPKSDMSWAAIVSLICGIVSIIPGICCCLLGLPAAAAGIVFGILGMKSEKGMLAKIGLGLSAGGIVLWIVLLILQLVLHIAVPGARSGF